VFIMDHCDYLTIATSYASIVDARVEGEGRYVQGVTRMSPCQYLYQNETHSDGTPKWPLRTDPLHPHPYGLSLWTPHLSDRQLDSILPLPLKMNVDPAKLPMVWSAYGNPNWGGHLDGECANDSDWDSHDDEEEANYYMMLDRENVALGLPSREQLQQLDGKARPPAGMDAWWWHVRELLRPTDRGPADPSQRKGRNSAANGCWRVQRLGPPMVPPACTGAGLLRSCGSVHPVQARPS